MTNEPNAQPHYLPGRKAFDNNSNTFLY